MDEGEGHDYVGGVRLDRRDSALRRWLSRLMNRVRERITHIRMTDQGCMLRAYSRDIVEAINACRESSTFIPALAYTFSRRPAEVEVAHEERAAGESKYPFYRLVRLNFDLVTGFSIVPLQLFSLFGILVSIVSVIVYFVVMVNRVVSGEPLTALRTFWDRDLLQFFLTGIVLFGLGLVGEYVGRIYQQVRHRPRYLVQAVLEKQKGDEKQHSEQWPQKQSSSATAT
jgi:undecaprenyl-phosphate 4-deoxy-4-formamido-L-arabinose transferase